MGWFEGLWAGKDWGLDGGVGFWVGKWGLPFGNGNVSGIYCGGIDVREEGWRTGRGVGVCWGKGDWIYIKGGKSAGRRERRLERGV